MKMTRNEAREMERKISDDDGFREKLRYRSQWECRETAKSDTDFVTDSDYWSYDEYVSQKYPNVVIVIEDGPGMTGAVFASVVIIDRKKYEKDCLESSKLNFGKEKDAYERFIFEEMRCGNYGRYAL